jgi:hypothetical protein
MKKITEGLEYGDLRGLVSYVISIDRHKTKIGSEEDNVVVAFKLKYHDPATDLALFIESSEVELLDVDVSVAPDHRGFYYVFVEFVRNFELYDNIAKLLTDINRVTSGDETKWKFIPYRNSGKKLDFTKENFKKHVITSAVKYRRIDKLNAQRRND